MHAVAVAVGVRDPVPEAGEQGALDLLHARVVLGARARTRCETATRRSRPDPGCRRRRCTPCHTSRGRHRRSTAAVEAAPSEGYDGDPPSSEVAAMLASSAPAGLPASSPPGWLPPLEPPPIRAPPEPLLRGPTCGNDRQHHEDRMLAHPRTVSRGVPRGFQQRDRLPRSLAPTPARSRRAHASDAPGPPLTSRRASASSAA